MVVQDDFRELLALFRSHDVAFVVVGAHALAHHGAPRFTGDLDILVEPSVSNARRVMSALTAFGFGAVGLTAGDFTQSGRIVQLGVPPVRVDILTSLSGVSWEQAWGGALGGAYGDVEVRYLGRNELIANKRATGRAKDLADIEALGG